MVVHPFPRGRLSAGVAARCGLNFGFGSRRAGRGVGNALDRIGNTAHRRAEIRQVDQGKQQPCDPEDMHVGKELYQPEHGDKFELQLL